MSALFITKNVQQIYVRLRCSQRTLLGDGGYSLETEIVIAYKDAPMVPMKGLVGASNCVGFPDTKDVIENNDNQFFDTSDVSDVSPRFSQE